MRQAVGGNPAAPSLHFVLDGVGYRDNAQSPAGVSGSVFHSMLAYISIRVYAEAEALLLKKCRSDFEWQIYSLLLCLFTIAIDSGTTITRRCLWPLCGQIFVDGG